MWERREVIWKKRRSRTAIAMWKHATTLSHPDTAQKRTYYVSSTHTESTLTHKHENTNRHSRVYCLCNLELQSFQTARHVEDWWEVHCNYY
jgi:hypothetical protein